MRTALMLIVVLAGPLAVTWGQVDDTSPDPRPAGADVTRKASDDTPFPPVEGKPLKIDLPIIGDALGSTPEDFVGGFEVLSAQRSHRRVATLMEGTRPLDLFADTGYAAFTDRRVRTFWTFGPARAKAAQFQLTNGRISRLALHYAALSQNDIRQLEQRLLPYVGGQPEEVRTGHRSQFNSTRVILGTGKQKLPVPVWCTITTNTRGPANQPRDYCVVFEVDPVAWHLAYNDVSDEIIKAMRDGKPVPGMTREQVICVIRDRRARERMTHDPTTRQPTGPVIEWFEHSEHWNEDRVIARASFDNDGKLTKFETWSADAPNSPKLNGG